MLVGDCSTFAIESKIADAVECASQFAVGSFVIHVGGRAFGVQDPDASMLGCSYLEVENRLQRRGTHRFPLVSDVPAADLANAYLDALYRDCSRTDFFGLSKHDFVDALVSSGSIWAPDGDAAFDDGSHILQFDIGGRVRIIAFLNTESRDVLSDTMRAISIDADLFYAIISSWKTLFATERTNKLKSKHPSHPNQSNCLSGDYGAPEPPRR